MLNFDVLFQGRVMTFSIKITHIVIFCTESTDGTNVNSLAYPI
jgi:hypothetical protein